MREIIKKYRDKTRYDFSCSESILHAANEYYNLKLSNNEFRMMASFSGGLFEGDLCGIVSASASVLGILFTNNVAHTSPVLQEAVLLYQDSFRELFDTNVCKNLVLKHRDEVEGCRDLIIEGAVLLDKIVCQIREKYKI